MVILESEKDGVILESEKDGDILLVFYILWSSDM